MLRSRLRPAIIQLNGGISRDRELAGFERVRPELASKAEELFDETGVVLIGTVSKYGCLVSARWSRWSWRANGNPG